MDLITKFVADNDCGIYKYIRMSREGGEVPSTVFHNSTRTSTDKDRADLFNSYFCSVFTHSSFVLPSHENVSESGQLT